MIERIERRSLFRLVSALAIAGGATVFSRPGRAAAGPSAYKLGTGDKLRVTVYGEPNLSGQFDVNDQGAVTLPLIGAVKVAGSTISEAETDITQRYGKDYLVNPRVNIEVLNYRPFFILGEVGHPASYPYIVGMTVINAVALAGGYTPRANRGRIMIKHAADPGAGEQPAAEDDPVLPGDVIRVPERFF